MDMRLGIVCYIIFPMEVWSKQKAKKETKSARFPFQTVSVGGDSGRETCGPSAVRRKRSAWTRAVGILTDAQTLH
jgi:hypothetical protein